MSASPAEQIAHALQAQQRPGETIRKGPGGALYLGDGRIFVAKFNPATQEASVSPHALADIGEVRVEGGRETPGKEPAWFVEIGLADRPATGLPEGDGSVEADYAQRPNVIYCGRGHEAEQLARQLDRALAAAVAPPPPPPPPEPAPAFPADWYPDPHGKARLRYWDGSAWTDHVAE